MSGAFSCVSNQSELTRIFSIIVFVFILVGTTVAVIVDVPAALNADSHARTDDRGRSYDGRFVVASIGNRL